MARSRDLRKPMIPADYIVYVIDDDVRVCEAMRELFASLGLPSVTFGSVAEYVAYPKPDLTACLILDVELPRSEEHTSELQSPDHLVCPLLLEKKKAAYSPARGHHSLRLPWWVELRSVH